MDILDLGDGIVTLIRQLTGRYAMTDHPSHRWSTPLTDWRCWNCDCRPGSRAAEFECGVEPALPLARPFPLLDAMAEAEEREVGGLA